MTGINIPHDVAVLGSSYDELISEASYPPQAGLSAATEQIGLTAASVLDRMMQGETLTQREWHLESEGVVEKLSIDTLAVEDARIAKVMRYLNANALKPITVDDVLKTNPMARRSLERKFRKLFGCTVIEQIRQIRVNHVRRLLAETDQSITQISSQCGFSSYNYLNRVFKSTTGLSPSQFRDQCKQGNKPNGQTSDARVFANS